MKFSFSLVTGAAALSMENESFKKIQEVCAKMTTDFTADKKEAEVLLAKESTQFAEEIKNLNSEIGRQTENLDSATSAHDACASDAEAAGSQANLLTVAIEKLNQDLDVANQDQAMAAQSCKDTSAALSEQADRLQLARTQLTTTHSELSLAQVQELVRGMKQEPAQAIVKNYESGLQPLIQLVDDLLSETSSSLQEHETACSNGAQNHALMKTDTENDVAAKSEELETAKNDQAKAQECAAHEQKNADEASAALDAANESLSNTKAAKHQKERESNQIIADLASTLDGLAQVTELLTDVEAGASHIERVPASFLLQLISAPTEKLSAFLLKRSRELKAPALSTLAAKVSTHATSFDNVKKMINDLISSLQAQSLEDTTLNAWCENEQAANADHYANLNEEADLQANNVDTFSAEIELLSETIANLADEITTTAEEQAAATENRAAEKAENEKVIAEGNTAIDALAQIIQIVKDKVVGEAAQGRLLPIFKDMHGNVIALVEATTTDEDESADLYTEETNAREVKTAALNQSKLNNEGSLQTTKKDLQDAEKNLDEVQYQLKNAEKVQEATAARCNPAMSHEEKMADLNEQIESLKEALQIIQNA